jgi:hypothetical protein
VAHLIIGHTTETTARIWVRGDKACTCRVVLHPSGDPVPPAVLNGDTDFSGVVDVTGLTAGTIYIVEATFFSRPNQKVSGRFQTFPNHPHDQPSSFSFVLSSCNLSVVSINNFLARLLATAGAMTALTSLDLPLQRWRAPRFRWLRWLLRNPLKIGLGLTAEWIKGTTAIKQPGPPYIRSPFLKLSAIFESWVLNLDEVTSPPSVGERVYVQRGASGVVACSPTVEKENKDGRPDNAGKITRCTLVLTAVEGTFKEGQRVFRQGQRASNDEKEPPSHFLGRIKVKGILPGKQWYSPPSFFVHAGDQIYYDFPDIDRVPERNDYRVAYREALFYDVANRHLLSHWPHYMTLDDHEIADQFARDFYPARSYDSPITYLSEANVAYREYVRALSPDVDEARRKFGPYWYQFDKGFTRFFVLDIRTQRSNREGQMIDADQMRRLLDWMFRYKDDLKFVVTSVPFVAQVSDAEDTRTLRWTDGEPRRNDENDKWSATRFKKQRDQIIEHIAENNIQRLIFLTGDMHSCYHASMRIAVKAERPIEAEPKYESLIIHELAGGPVNQLQLADTAEFDRRCSGRTSKGFAYETVLDRFHGQVNAVMHLNVEYVEREQTSNPDRALAPEVEWNVIRTLTDNEAADWPVEKSPEHPRPPSPESVMNGRIGFVERRTPDALPRW